MWLDIEQDKVCTYLNTDLILIIRLDYASVIIGGHGGSTFLFESCIEAEAFYDGFKLALNGIDFLMGEGDSYCHIKPLRIEKSRALHEHLMLQEVLNDRT